MSGIKRYALSVDKISGCPCVPTITEDSNGKFVTYQVYMSLLLEYAEFKKSVEARGYR